MSIDHTPGRWACSPHGRIYGPNGRDILLTGNSPEAAANRARLNELLSAQPAPNSLMERFSAFKPLARTA